MAEPDELAAPADDARPLSDRAGSALPAPPAPPALGAPWAEAGAFPRDTSAPEAGAADPLKTRPMTPFRCASSHTSTLSTACGSRVFSSPDCCRSVGASQEP